MDESWQLFDELRSSGTITTPSAPSLSLTLAARDKKLQKQHRARQIADFRAKHHVYMSVDPSQYGPCREECLSSYEEDRRLSLYLCTRHGRIHDCSNSTTHPFVKVTTDGHMVCGVSGMIIASQVIDHRRIVKRADMGDGGGKRTFGVRDVKSNTTLYDEIGDGNLDDDDDGRDAHTNGYYDDNCGGGCDDDDDMNGTSKGDSQFIMRADDADAFAGYDGLVGEDDVFSFGDDEEEHPPPPPQNNNKGEKDDNEADDDDDDSMCKKLEDELERADAESDNDAQTIELPSDAVTRSLSTILRRPINIQAPPATIATSPSAMTRKRTVESASQTLSQQQSPQQQQQQISTFTSSVPDRQAKKPALQKTSGTDNTDDGSENSRQSTATTNKKVLRQLSSPDDFSFHESMKDLEDVIERVFNELLSQQRQKDATKQTLKAKRNKLSNEMRAYIRNCTRRGEQVNVDMMRRMKSELLENNGDEVEATCLLTSDERTRIKLVIQRAWATLRSFVSSKQAPNGTNTQARNVKPQFVLGMLYYLREGLTLNGTTIVTAQECLQKLPSYTLLMQNAKYKHNMITNGKNAIKSALVQATDAGHSLAEVVISIFPQKRHFNLQTISLANL